MAKDVPFYGNQDDDMHCALACYRMLLKYFTDKEWSWDELEQLSGFANSTAAWTVTTWTALAKQGFDIRMLEAFDYGRYLSEGDAYLRKYFVDPEEYRWQVELSNVAEIKDEIPEFLRTVQHEQRSPSVADVSDMLAEGYLVCVGINARKLYDQEGYSAHMVLVYAEDGDEFVLHDPGLPPVPACRVSKAKLYEAMGGEATRTEVTGVKLGTT